MDGVLLILTTLSLAAAAGFGVLSWRVGREERERTRARVAALSAAMGPEGSSHGPGAVDAAVDTRVAVGSVFDRTGEGLRGRAMITLAVGVVMAVAIVIGALIGVRSADTAASPAQAPAPLELMSMRYQRQGTTLTVSGLVRNPAAGASMNGVTAVVFAFNGSGAFVASGRAPLDFSALKPGEESPFVVSVPNVGSVARYRVTFRNGDSVIRHIDRRTNQVQLAQAVR